MARQAPSKFTYNPAFETAPVWSPDGATILYRSTQDGGSVFAKDSNGTGTERLVLKASINGPQQVSQDGKLLLYFAPRAGQMDIFVLPLAGDSKPTAIVETPFVDSEPQFSPDGRFLAYYSNETGRNEIYVQPYPTTGERWKISNSGGRQPLWRHDGKELFFVSDDKKFYAVDIQTKPVFDYGVPHFLFDLRANVFNTRNSYIPSRDGRRFLVNMLLDTAPAPITVIYNWTEGSKKE